MLVASVVALAAVAQSVAGFGFGLVCSSVLIAVLGHDEGLRLVITLSLVMNVTLLVQDPRNARVREAVVLALPAVLCTVPLVLVLGHANSDALTVAAGTITVAAALALVKGLRVARLRGLTGALGAGFISAVMNVVGGLSGPSVALYAVNADWPPLTVTPTLQVFGLITNLVALSALGGPTLTGDAVGGLLAGWVVGLIIARRLSGAHLRMGVLAVATAGGLYAVARGLGL